MTKEKGERPSVSLPTKVAGGFLFGVLFLLLHAWLPIQAERSAVQLKRMEAELSRKKSELNELNTRYAALTALPVLDNWAKTHGPWVPPSATNVIAIKE